MRKAIQTNKRSQITGRFIVETVNLARVSDGWAAAWRGKVTKAKTAVGATKLMRAKMDARQP